VSTGVRVYRLPPIAWQTVTTAPDYRIVTGAFAMLYHGMDRAQLDAAYNNSAAVRERDAIVAGWAARSARVRREYAGHLDLAYGDAPRERLDLFLAADPKAPTLAFIHGGYWQMNDKESFAFFAEGLLPLGINLAVIEYTLAPTARLDRIVAEVSRSMRWLTEHLGEYGADSNRLYVAGHSAGGHLTAMTMPLAEVRGGIAISGIFDLEPIRLNYLNEKLGLDLAEAERNSPVRRLPAKAGELVVAYGTEELPELCRQSTEYGRRWTERGLPGYLLPVDDADHFTILDALARPEGVLTRALLAMLGR
jgi:arylformamidase